MPNEPITAPTFPPPRELFEALVARVLDHTVRALDGHTALSPETLRARLEPAVIEALSDHFSRLEDRLLRAQRLAFVGQLSAGVAHELRNPLSVIETSVFILSERLADVPIAARQLKRISEQVSTATAIISELLEATRNRPIDRVPLDLAVVAREAIAQVPRPSHITLALDLAPGVALLNGDPRRLRQVVVNLLSNATRALQETPSPRLAVCVAATDDHATLTVDDNGPGIAPDDLPQLFEPLFSTRAEGTGLGLAISRRIAEAHGGTLTAANAPDGGARFTLTLPRPAPRA
jgi:signal transduction histidine kinase